MIFMSFESQYATSY